MRNYKFLGYRDGDPSKGTTVISLADYFDPDMKTTKLIHFSAGALWCPPCNEEAKALVPLVPRLKEKKVIIIQALIEGDARGTGSTLDDLNVWQKRHSVNFTLFLDPEQGNLGQFFDAAAVPWNAPHRCALDGDALVRLRVRREDDNEYRLDEVDRRESGPSRPVRVAFPRPLALAVAVTSLGAMRLERGRWWSSPRRQQPRVGRATDFTARDIDGQDGPSERLPRQAGHPARFLRDVVPAVPHGAAPPPSSSTRRSTREASSILAIAMDSSDTVAEVPAWARRNELKFPVLLDEDSHIASIYNPKKSAPLTVLIDKKGDVVYVHDGYNPGDEVLLEEHIAKVLDPTRPRSSFPRA